MTYLQRVRATIAQMEREGKPRPHPLARTAEAANWRRELAARLRMQSGRIIKEDQRELWGGDNGTAR
jgi:hypothetical protein